MEKKFSNLESLPKFSEIKIAEITAKVNSILNNNRKKIAELLKQEKFSWQNLFSPLEAMDNALDLAWNPINHLQSVQNSDELREVYNQCIAKLSEYATEMGQNEDLFRAIVQISEDPSYDSLDFAQKKIIQDALRDFRLTGVELAQDKKQRVAEIQKQLAALTTKFDENLLDATDNWTKHIENAEQLTGLPPHTLAYGANEAKKRGLSGWVLTLEFPCYHAVITYADDRQLRKEIYEAYVTRASDCGPNAGKWDNTAVMEEILALRHELAQLLGFGSFGEYSLVTKMVDSPESVLGFLQELVAHSLPIAKKEFSELEAFAKENSQIETLQPWDIPYFSDKLRQHRYAISQEECRPYFPEDKVVSGLFKLVGRLYGVRIEEVTEFDRWHDDVRLFTIFDINGACRAHFYMDLYARSQKRGGAWMADFCSRYRLDDGELQTPVAFLVCNFAGSSGDQPALFNHDEVITLFHEFGHGLHHMLTKIDYLSVSGINGVPWDGVELPSQFMENFCWEREVLDMISEHVETKQPIPDELYQRMQNARHFQTGMQMVRQLEFSLFDFRLHHEYTPEEGARIQQLLDQVRSQVAVVPIVEYNRFQHSFSHIFAGGYAAGYYSYKWAEVLSSDAYSKFEETGIFNQETGQSFLENILQMGGSKELMELFEAFRGRKPNIDALLRHSGIV